MIQHSGLDKNHKEIILGMISLFENEDKHSIGLYLGRLENLLSSHGK
jgi:hypothetical protein